MRHLLKFWLITGLALASMALPAGAARAQSPAPAIYLAMGDSLAVGVGATDPARTGYVPHLFDFLHGAAQGGVDELANLGASGETSGSFLGEEGSQAARALMIINTPDTIVSAATLDIGGDDLLHLIAPPAGYPPAPCASEPDSPFCQLATQEALARFAAHDETILATLAPALAANSGHTPLVVLTAYNPWSGAGSRFEAPIDRALLGSDGVIDCAANATDPARVGLNDLIACIGQQHGALVADVYPAFQGKGRALTHIADGNPHPNDAGYAQIANVVARVYPGGPCFPGGPCHVPPPGP
jgi:acyl-CoA thioesterase-1